jgi:hypothetical protein
MYAEQLPPSERDFGVIEKYEGLDQITNTGRVDQSCDRTLPLAGGAKHDTASADICGGRTQRDYIEVRGLHPGYVGWAHSVSKLGKGRQAKFLSGGGQRRLS